MFLLPRLLQAMAIDSLMPPCLGYVHPKRNTAIFAILIPAAVIGKANKKFKSLFTVIHTKRASNFNL